MTYSNLNYQIKFTFSQLQRLKRWSIYWNVIFNNQTIKLSNSVLVSSVFYNTRIKTTFYLLQTSLNHSLIHLLNEPITSFIFLFSFSFFFLLMNTGHIAQEFSGCQRWRPGHAKGKGKWIQTAGKMVVELSFWHLGSALSPSQVNLRPCVGHCIFIFPLACPFTAAVCSKASQGHMTFEISQ